MEIEHVNKFQKSNHLVNKRKLSFLYKIPVTFNVVAISHVSRTAFDYLPPFNPTCGDKMNIYPTWQGYSQSNAFFKPRNITLIFQYRDIACHPFVQGDYESNMFSNNRVKR